MINAIIYDLDNCLFSATRVPEETLRSALEVLRQANKGEDALAENILEEALAACRTHAFDEVAQQYHLPRQLREAAKRAFQSLQVQEPLTPYPDLAAIEHMPGKRFLVTTGYRQFQESKIAALGIGHLFDSVFIDALDDKERVGKEHLFKQILEEHAFASSDVLVVGDNPASEIAAGNRLGMVTVQIVRPGVKRGPNAQFYIGSLYELREIVPYCARGG